MVLMFPVYVVNRLSIDLTAKIAVSNQVSLDLPAIILVLYVYEDTDWKKIMDFSARIIVFMCLWGHKVEEND